MHSQRPASQSCHIHPLYRHLVTLIRVLSHLLQIKLYDVPHTGEQSRPEYPSMDVPDISIPPATAPSSSSPIPVPPRVQRSTTKLSLTELINQTRERHIKARFIDLTDEVSPLRDGNAASSAFASKPHESMQPPSTKAAGPVSASQPAPSNEIRTPSIQEIRDLMRQRPSSNKLSTSSAADNPSTSSAATDPSTSSVASNPSSSSIASATSPLVPSRSPPRSFMSNSTTSTTQSGSKPSSRRKSRAMGVASLEMYISPIKDASQPASSKKKTWTPRSGKRMSYNADKFRSIITPTADATVRSQSLSPSEGRELRRPAGFADTGTDAALAVLSSPSAQTRVPFGAPPVRHEEPEATPSTLPSAIPLTEVQKLESGKLHTHEGFSPRENAVHDMFRPEGIQGVTESIGSLDLREDSWSPNVDIDIDQVRQLSLENVCEDGVQAIPVSTELMEHEEFESMEELVGNVSAGSVAEAPASLGKYRESNEEDGDADTRAIRTSAERTSGTSDVSGEISEQEECLAVLMELEVSDREAGDAEHPNSISSSRTASSHVSSRQTPETLRSAEPLNVVRSGGAASIGQLEDGVESYLGGYPIVTWKSYANAQRRLPPKYNLAKDLPHELQDRVNALPQSYRNSDQARLLFEAMIDEAMDDELNTPPISVINDVTDEGAPPWEFVYTNQMWNGEGVPPPDIKNLKSCGCVGRCDPKSKTCSCAKRQRRHLKQYIEDDTIPKTWNGAPFVYDGKGCLQFFGLPIFECNAFCGCDEDCPNRVVQRGRRYVVNIKKTKNKGWGVFNGQKKIPKGSFIGVYAGELLTVGEADRRGTLYNKFGRTYLFDIDFHHMGSEAVYSVDAYHAGNLTRFLNHSCDPNCEIQACYINEANFNKPLLTVFTVREVEPLEELSFSYMGQIDDDMVNHAKASNDAVYAECHCGSANCLGVLFSGL
ncbi:SET domain-containing protein [Rhizopogon vinicolor AM-OR11-026]|uniref:SET domain-containing protein n=1 Tax=Rhizopogon vinicolor AM-OR11-026 TaxID=1314800 RepID=A0A1B7N1U1_9AGAM|nr:SET domain-containing protein [Rhizopogon vinicolor AM-OR11-026]